jgi:CheY-like chemotaxis protein
VFKNKRKRRPGVLIADGDEMVRRMLDEGLRREGFAVWSAGDGEETLEVYQCHRREIDLVLLEILMANGSGLETLEALRVINPDIRCCFMNGCAGDCSEEEILKRGAEAFLYKPFGSAEVAQVLWRLLGRRKKKFKGSRCPSVACWR